MRYGYTDEPGHLGATRNARYFWITFTDAQVEKDSNPPRLHEPVISNEVKPTLDSVYRYVYIGGQNQHIPQIEVQIGCQFTPNPDALHPVEINRWVTHKEIDGKTYIYYVVDVRI